MTDKEKEDRKLVVMTDIMVEGEELVVTEGQRETSVTNSVGKESATNQTGMVKINDKVPKKEIWGITNFFTRQQNESTTFHTHTQESVTKQNRISRMTSVSRQIMR